MAFSLMKAGAQPVSQPPAARAMPAVVLNMGLAASASRPATRFFRLPTSALHPMYAPAPF